MRPVGCITSRTAAIGKAIADGRLGKVGHISAAVSFYKPFQSDDHRLDAKVWVAGVLLDLAWYAGGLARFASGKMPERVFASAIMQQGVPIRVTAMLWFADDVTATLSCGYDTATRKWFEIAGSDASIVCDDFTRPWADKPARCWVHDATGDVEQWKYDGTQERDDDQPTLWRSSRCRTSTRKPSIRSKCLDALQRSIDTNAVVSTDASAAGITGDLPS